MTTPKMNFKSFNFRPLLGLCSTLLCLRGQLPRSFGSLHGFPGAFSRLVGCDQLLPLAQVGELVVERKRLWVSDLAYQHLVLLDYLVALGFVSLNAGDGSLDAGNMADDAGDDPVALRA